MKETFPSSSKLTDICDYIEYLTFLDGECNFRDLLEEFADSGSDKVSGLFPEKQNIVQELSRRLRLYAPYVPYTVCTNKISSAFANDDLKEANMQYLFCLYYSLYGANQVSREHSSLFERIVNSSLKCYLGDSTKSIVTSFGDTSLNIQQKIEEVLRQTCEVIGNTSEMSHYTKDAGVDIVTFKPLDDRGNQIIILTDATLGRNWSTSKHVILKLNQWCEYIHFKVKPIACLAISSIVVPEDFHSHSKNNGLLLDRARIMSYYKPDEDADILLDLKRWRDAV